MKTAVIYARYSSERQSEQSIEGQLRVCHEFAERNELKIIDTYIDRAMTGTNDNRAAFQKMLADSDKPQPWDIVLVYALDRFGRNSIEVAVNKQRLQKNGKILISATQRTSVNIDGTQNLDGIILENVLIGLSEYYSAELSQKIRRGQNESRLKGNFAGGQVPYGYTTENKKIVVHNERAEIVRWIYQSYAAGKVVREIIGELTARGVTHMGKPFKLNTVYKILRLEKYIGIYRHGDEVFTNIYPQIVPTDLFDRVQTLLAKNKLGSSSREVVFMLKKKVVCGICGRPINGESGTSQNGTTMYYYKCSNRKKHRSCSKKSVKKADLEEVVLNTTLLLLNKPENLSVIADEIIAIHQKRAREQAVLTLLRDERSKAQKALDNLMKALEAGIFTATTKDRITELESEIDELNGRILTEECKEANLLTKKDIETFLLDALKSEPQLLIDTLVDKIILHDDKIEIYYKYTQNNNPDDTNSPELSAADNSGLFNKDRRDFCLPSKRRVSVTHRHIIYTADITASRGA